MSINSRNELKEYALRKLGHPVMQINVAEEQLQDRIDEALETYWEFHHEGSYRHFITHPLTQNDLLTKRITLDPWVYAVLRILMIGGLDSSLNLQYQSLMQNIGNQIISNADGLTNYAISMSYLALVNDLFSSVKRINFNQRHGIVTIDSSLDEYRIGDYLVFEVYQLTNPDEVWDCWNSPWLKAYTTALIKKQWGQNMIKYSGFQLPSGITLNGRDIYQDALQDIEKLEADLMSKESFPPDFFMG